MYNIKIFSVTVKEVLSETHNQAPLIHQPKLLKEEVNVNNSQEHAQANLNIVKTDGDNSLLAEPEHVEKKIKKKSRKSADGSPTQKSSQKSRKKSLKSENSVDLTNEEDTAKPVDCLSSANSMDDLECSGEVLTETINIKTNTCNFLDVDALESINKNKSYELDLKSRSEICSKETEKISENVEGDLDSTKSAKKRKSKKKSNKLNARSESVESLDNLEDDTISSVSEVVTSGTETATDEIKKRKSKKKSNKLNLRSESVESLDNLEDEIMSGTSETVPTGMEISADEVYTKKKKSVKERKTNKSISENQVDDDLNVEIPSSVTKNPANYEQQQENYINADVIASSKLRSSLVSQNAPSDNITVHIQDIKITDSLYLNSDDCFRRDSNETIFRPSVPETAIHPPVPASAKVIKPNWALEQQHDIKVKPISPSSQRDKSDLKLPGFDKKNNEQISSNSRQKQLSPDFEMKEIEQLSSDFERRKFEQKSPDFERKKYEQKSLDLDKKDSKQKSEDSERKELEQKSQDFERKKFDLKSPDFERKKNYSSTDFVEKKFEQKSPDFDRKRYEKKSLDFDRKNELKQKPEDFEKKKLEQKSPNFERKKYEQKFPGIERTEDEPKSIDFEKKKFEQKSPDFERKKFEQKSPDFDRKKFEQKSPDFEKKKFEQKSPDFERKKFEQQSPDFERKKLEQKSPDFERIHFEQKVPAIEKEKHEQRSLDFANKIQIISKEVDFAKHDDKKMLNVNKSHETAKQADMNECKNLDVMHPNESMKKSIQPAKSSKEKNELKIDNSFDINIGTKLSESIQPSYTEISSSGLFANDCDNKKQSYDSKSLQAEEQKSLNFDSEDDITGLKKEGVRKSKKEKKSKKNKNATTKETETDFQLEKQKVGEMQKELEERQKEYVNEKDHKRLAIKSTQAVAKEDSNVSTEKPKLPEKLGNNEHENIAQKTATEFSSTGYKNIREKIKEADSVVIEGLQMYGSTSAKLPNSLAGSKTCSEMQTSDKTQFDQQEARLDNKEMARQYNPAQLNNEGNVTTSNLTFLDKLKLAKELQKGIATQVVQQKQFMAEGSVIVDKQFNRQASLTKISNRNASSNKEGDREMQTRQLPLQSVQVDANSFKGMQTTTKCEPPFDNITKFSDTQKENNILKTNELISTSQPTVLQKKPPPPVPPKKVKAEPAKLVAPAQPNDKPLPPPKPSKKPDLQLLQPAKRDFVRDVLLDSTAAVPVDEEDGALSFSKAAQFRWSERKPTNLKKEERLSKLMKINKDTCDEAVTNAKFNQTVVDELKSELKSSNLSGIDNKGSIVKKELKQADRKADNVLNKSEISASANIKSSQLQEPVQDSSKTNIQPPWFAMARLKSTNWSKQNPTPEKVSLLKFNNILKLDIYAYFTFYPKNNIVN